MLSKLLLAIVGAHMSYVMLIAYRYPGQTARGLWVLGGAFLAAVLLGGLYFPAWSGYPLFLLWFVGVLLPWIAGHQVQAALRRADIPGLRRWTGLLSVIQPRFPWAHYRQMYLAAAHLRRGEWEQALQLMDGHQQLPGLVGLWMRCERQIVYREWRELLAMTGQMVPKDEQTQRYMLERRVRAFLELEDLQSACGALEEFLRDRRLQPMELAQLALPVFALTGHADLTERLIKRHEGVTTLLMADYWRITALCRAGQPEEARRILEGLAGRGDALLLQRAQQRVGDGRTAASAAPEDQARLERIIEQLRAQLLG